MFFLYFHMPNIKTINKRIMVWGSRYWFYCIHISQPISPQGLGPPLLTPPYMAYLEIEIMEGTTIVLILEAILQPFYRY